MLSQTEIEFCIDNQWGQAEAQPPEKGQRYVQSLDSEHWKQKQQPTGIGFQIRLVDFHF